MGVPLPAHDVVEGCAEELRMGGDGDEMTSKEAAARRVTQVKVKSPGRLRAGPRNGPPLVVIARAT